MNSFEQMGEAQLAAHEGQRQIAAALADVMKKAFLRVVDMISRSSPGPFAL
jgi:hypothetical protein